MILSSSDSLILRRVFLSTCILFLPTLVFFLYLSLFGLASDNLIL